MNPSASRRGFDPYDLCEPEPVPWHSPVRRLPVAELEDNDSDSTIVLPSVLEAEPEHTRAQPPPRPLTPIPRHMYYPFAETSVMNMDYDAILPIPTLQSLNWVVHQTPELEGHIRPSSSHSKDATQSRSRPSLLSVVSDPRTRDAKSASSSSSRNPVKKGLRKSLGSYVSALRNKGRWIKNFRDNHLRQPSRSPRRGDLPLPPRSILRPRPNTSGLGQKQIRNSISSKPEVPALSSDGQPLVQRTRQTVNSSNRSSNYLTQPDGTWLSTTLAAPCDLMVMVVERTTIQLGSSRGCRKALKYTMRLKKKLDCIHFCGVSVMLHYRSTRLASSVCYVDQSRPNWVGDVDQWRHGVFPGKPGSSPGSSFTNPSDAMAAGNGYFSPPNSLGVPSPAISPTGQVPPAVHPGRYCPPAQTLGVPSPAISPTRQFYSAVPPGWYYPPPMPSGHFYNGPVPLPTMGPIPVNNTGPFLPMPTNRSSGVVTADKSHWKQSRARSMYSVNDYPVSARNFYLSPRGRFSLQWRQPNIEGSPSIQATSIADHHICSSPCAKNRAQCHGTADGDSKKQSLPCRSALRPEAPEFIPRRSRWNETRAQQLSQPSTYPSLPRSNGNWALMPGQGYGMPNPRQHQYPFIV
ncbi:uncharacterized protein BP01DRAFT_365398 [Aspergillus saccharolyticus JOP 1030-1]|uniref:Uncharacterized protein n=1 Tax=Aspergillus saccharolyticus JOP 1030-1 TaxID=1450539 RepID=A0A318ZP77_9EURO|nr:hypothetical protein BP01DRAFT_365398 [Aspergillus saccharolyticus JOP 1030-1]PYH45710.1 hypothetical protein BP01DRAFT_365398 [Aspergillus saccharolyticus JOP 1030-1]